MTTTNPDTKRGKNGRSAYEERIDALNGLAESCEDGSRTYEAAAELAEDPKLRELFQSYSARRKMHRDEICADIVRLGGKPSRLESIESVLSRGWMTVRAIFPRSEHAILARCMRLEASTWSRYAVALRSDLDPVAHLRLDEQSRQSRQMHLFLDARSSGHVVQPV